MNQSDRNFWWQILPSRWFLNKRLKIGSDTSETSDNFTEDHRGSFPLLSYFTFSSLVLFLIATVFLNYAYRRNAIANLTTLGEKENAILAKSFANSLEGIIKPYLTKSSRVIARNMKPKIN